MVSNYLLLRYQYKFRGQGWARSDLCGMICSLNELVEICTGEQFCEAALVQAPHPWTGPGESGRCGHIHWSSISSGQSIPDRCHSSPRRQLQNHWLSAALDSCPVLSPSLTEGTRSWSHTPTAFWETPPRRVVRGNFIELETFWISDPEVFAALLLWIFFFFLALFLWK